MTNQNIIRLVLTVLILGLLVVVIVRPIRARAALYFKLPPPYLTATTTPAITHVKK